MTRSTVGIAKPRARPKTEVIRLRAEPKLKAQIETEAKRLRVSVSGWITEAIELALARGSTR